MAEQQAASARTIGGPGRGRRRALIAAAALLVLAGVLIAILVPSHRPPGSSPAARAGAEKRAAAAAAGSAGLGGAGSGGGAPAPATSPRAATRSGAGAAAAGTRGAAAIAAAYLGLSPAQVRDRMSAGHTLAAIAAATPGKSAAGLIDVIVRERTAALRRRLAPARLHARLRRLRTIVAASVDRLPQSARASERVLSLAAAYLGVSRARLRAEIVAGRTLAQVARSTPGRSEGGLVAALLAAERARVQRALAAGRIDRATASRMLTALPRRLSAAVRR